MFRILGAGTEVKKTPTGRHERPRKKPPYLFLDAFCLNRYCARTQFGRIQKFQVAANEHNIPMSGIYYYVRRDEEVFGPALPRQLIVAAEKGIILPSDELANSRDGPWYCAATCVELWENEDEETDEANECFIVWEGTERSGPFSKRQLQVLLDSDHLSPNTYVADIDGRLTQLGSVLGITNRTEVAASLHTESQESTQQTSAPKSQERSPTKKRSRKKRSRKKTKETRKEPRRKSPTDSQQLALQELLAAELAPPPLTSDRDAETAGAETRQQSPPRTTKDSASGSPRELTFIKTLRSRVRSQSFHQAYLLISILLAVQSAIYLVAVGVLTTEFLARISTLAIAVFAPFGSEVEQLQETDLAFAGISSVLLCAELLLPLFFLIRVDADFRLWATATLVGVIVGIAMTAEGLTGIGTAARWAIVVCGFGIAAGGLLITWLTPAQSRWMFLGLAVSAITAGGACYLGLVGGNEGLTFELVSLPPYLKGESIPMLIATGLSLLAVWLPIPVYCLHMLSTQADDSTRSYISFHLGKLCVLGFVGLFCVGFLGIGSDPRYLSVPLAMLAMTLGAVICALSPPVMWLLQPDYVVR
jgi:hypothetical protein